MEAFISLFNQYNVPAAFLVNIELTLWSTLFSTILGVIPVSYTHLTLPTTSRV